MINKIEGYLAKTNVTSLNDNVFNLIDKEWMLITAGNTGSFNTMTASWGTLGILWNKPVAICFIRPHRYTFEFAEKSDYFTLSFFDESFRGILNICGSKSGRTIDKIKETCLKPLLTDNGGIGYEQARMVIECRKLYADFLKEDNFVVPDTALKNYPSKDFHKFYIGEIVNCYLKHS
ncbi:MAG: flavin reductase [Bacteroidales bacterium]|nr:flavin reductase [Bacteroidales bacterium]